MSTHYFPYLLLCCTLSAYADLPHRASDISDQQHQQWQRLEQTQQKREETILIDGVKEKTVADESELNQDINDASFALMNAINHAQWDQVQQQLASYQTMDGHEKGLVWLAEGSLARARGDYAAAQKAYQALLADYPDFVRARLDLARLLFEDHQNKEAQQAFLAIDRTNLPVEVQNNINTYLNALKLREQSNGSLSFGFGYADNLNQSPRQEPVCLSYHPLGFCENLRSSPAPIRAQSVNYAATLSKRYALNTHHGIQIHTALSGNIYQNQRDFNEHNASLAIGYDYRNAHHHLFAAPFYEHDTYGNRSMYRATGAKVQWTYRFSGSLNAHLQFEHKNQRYLAENYHHHNGTQNTLYAGLNYARNNSLYYASLDASQQNARAHALGYRQIGARLGFYHPFNAGFTTHFSATLRHKNYRERQANLDTRRRDTEQIYSLSLGAPRWAIKGFTPSLNLRHHRIKSSLDWLYSHHRNEITLKWEKFF